MPIDVDVYDDYRLRVAIIEVAHANEMNLLLSGLLASQLDRQKQTWTVTWSDYLQMKEKMDKMGLTSGRTATNEAMAWIKNQEALDTEMTSIKGGKENHLVGDLSAIKTKLYEDQVSGVRFLQAAGMKRRFAILADEMGIGKTLQLLAAFAGMKSKNEARHMLVVSPNTVKTGWIKQVEQHTNLSVRMLGNGITQLMSDFAEYKKKRTDILCVHYDGFVAQKTKHNKPKNDWNELVEELLKLPWDIVTLDEAHQVKTLDAKRTKATMHFAHFAKTAKKLRVILYWVTGTPISESPLDSWTVLTFGDKRLLPRSYSRFENYFSRVTKTEFGLTRTGYKNLWELKQILHRSMIRRLKSDIKGMPEKVSEFRYIQMNGSQKALYDDIKKGVYDTFVQDPNDKLSIAFAMTKCIRLRQVLNHPKLVEKDGESTKYKEIDALLEEILADSMSKVVIWTEWREAAQILSQRYKSKYGTIELMGGVDQKQLAYLGKNWDTMPEQVAIGIPMFGGTGVDFLNRCRTAIYVEPPYSLILFRQSMDRIHRRVGEIKTEIDKIKSSPATLIFLQVEKTLDELVYKILGRKGDIADSILTEDEKLVEIGRSELLEYLK